MERTCDVGCIVQALTLGLWRRSYSPMPPSSLAKRLYGFRTSPVSNDLLAVNEADKLPEDSLILLITLEVIEGTTGKKDAVNAFVELRLTPAHTSAGDQLQRSDVKCGTAQAQPRFENPVVATFELLVTRTALSTSRVILSVHHLATNSASPILLGDAVLHVNELPLPQTSSTDANSSSSSSSSGRRTLKLHNEAGAQGTISLLASLVTPDDHCLCRDHCIYEFQRWRGTTRDWGHDSTHLLPSDPGRWASLDGTLFGANIDDVAPAVPDGYRIDKAWYILSTELDPDGWEYAEGFWASLWAPRPDSRLGLIVRRRTMIRRIALA